MKIQITRTIGIEKQRTTLMGDKMFIVMTNGDKITITKTKERIRSIHDNSDYNTPEDPFIMAFLQDAKYKNLAAINLNDMWLSKADLSGIEVEDIIYELYIIANPDSDVRY
jgi:hypothetical protein